MLTNNNYLNQPFPKALLKVIKSNITVNDVVLDIGCGNKAISSQLLCKKIITLDVWDRVCPDILLDLNTNNLPFEEKSIDVILMLDFIEHINKERGYVIIDQAKNIARKKIILLTPLWWTDNSENVNNPEMWSYNNEHDYHKSLWDLNDFVEWSRISNIVGGDNYFIGVWSV